MVSRSESSLQTMFKNDSPTFNGGYPSGSRDAFAGRRATVRPEQLAATLQNLSSAENESRDESPKGGGPPGP